VYDAQLLAEGDRRNVVDRYRYWSMAAIVADLDTRRHDFHVAIENWQHDFNIGTIVRTANAFLASEVHVVGNRRWNRRGAMVTDRYQHVRHHVDVASLAAELHAAGVVLLGIDNLPGSAALETLELPRRVCLLFGQEGPGLSEAAREACDGTFSIAQFGSTRSINASAAAAIAMHTWIRQHADLSGPWRG
jgi:tRNA G18 (ribose-2'-O)-methylase SpoU